MKKSLPVSPVQPARFRGERLRELRESKGLDLESLAKRLALSPAQLRQLESNQGSLFYSDAIRFATARKVSEFLGETLVFEPAPLATEEQTQGSADAQVQTPAAQTPAASSELAGHSQVAAPRMLVRRIPPRESRIALSGWSAALWGLVMIFAVLLGLQALIEPKATLPESKSSAAGSESAARDAGASSVVPAAGVSMVSLEPQDLDVTPSSSVPASTLVAGQAVQAVTVAVPASAPASASVILSSTLPASSPAALQSNAAQTTQTCGESNGPIVSFTPTKADKDPAQLFVQGAPGQVVCVKDGRGQVWRHEFANSTGRSFSGTAPWLVESAQLTELQIYFQGNRARPSLAGATRLRLIAAEPA